MNKTPHDLAEDNMTLAEEYSRYSGQLAELIKQEAEFWENNKEKHKSDTATQRAFDRTEAGQRMSIIKLKLKSLMRTMSSNKLMVEVATNEAKGIY